MEDVDARLLQVSCHGYRLDGGDGVTLTALTPIENEEGAWVGDAVLPGLLPQTGMVNVDNGDDMGSSYHNTCPITGERAGNHVDGAICLYLTPERLVVGNKDDMGASYQNRCCVIVQRVSWELW